MKALPAVLIVLFVVITASSIGVNILWFVSIVALLALGVLIFFMLRAGRFMGPKVLMEDVSSSFVARDDVDNQPPLTIIESPSVSKDVE